MANPEKIVLLVDGDSFYEEDIVSQFRGYSCNCVFYAEQPDDETTPAFSCAPRSATAAAERAAG